MRCRFARVHAPRTAQHTQARLELACFDLYSTFTQCIYLYHHPHHFVSWFAIYHGGIIVASLCSITTVHQSTNGKH